MLSGLRHKYDDVRGKGFFAQTRREVIPHGHPSISRSGSVRSEQRSLGEKDLPPSGLRRIWPVASLLVGYSPRAGMRPPRASPQAKLGATNVIVFMPQTTKHVHSPETARRVACATHPRSSAFI